MLCRRKFVWSKKNFKIDILRQKNTRQHFLKMELFGIEFKNIKIFFYNVVQSILK